MIDNRMKTEIKKIGINGEGISYLDRLPVFVPQALPEELVEIEVTEKNKRFARGEMRRIIKKSSSRIQPKCRVQKLCGGCALMHARYEKQLEYKREILKQSLIKYAQIDPRKIAKVKASEQIFAYRNQFKMPCGESREGRLESGLFLPNSNCFQSVKHCLVHEKGLERLRLDVLQVLNAFGCQPYSHKTKKGIRSIVARGFAGKYQCTLVTGEDELSVALIRRLMKIKGMYSLWQSIHTVKKTSEVFGKEMRLLAGERYLPLALEELQLQISPRSFFQLNTAQAVSLYHTVAEMAGKQNELIVEAYSGIGGISMYLKDHAKEIIGIETIKDAVINANQNALRNNCAHVSFICADAADKLTWISKKRHIDVLVVDPPRSGLDDEMLECILRSRIKKVIYVSCNPATLGKNLAVLRARYEVEQVQAFDMFPHTPLIETIVLLQRRIM